MSNDSDLCKKTGKNFWDMKKMKEMKEKKAAANK